MDADSVPETIDWKYISGRNYGANDQIIIEFI